MLVQYSILYLLTYIIRLPFQSYMRGLRFPTNSNLNLTITKKAIIVFRAVSAIVIRSLISVKLLNVYQDTKRNDYLFTLENDIVKVINLPS